MHRYCQFFLFLICTPNCIRMSCRIFRSLFMPRVPFRVSGYLLYWKKMKKREILSYDKYQRYVLLCRHQFTLSESSFRTRQNFLAFHLVIYLVLNALPKLFPIHKQIFSGTMSNSYKIQNQTLKLSLILVLKYSC